MENKFVGHPTFNPGAFLSYKEKIFGNVCIIEESEISDGGHWGTDVYDLTNNRHMHLWSYDWESKDLEGTIKRWVNIPNIWEPFINCDEYTLKFYKGWIKSDLTGYKYYRSQLKNN